MNTVYIYISDNYSTHSHEMVFKLVEKLSHGACTEIEAYDGAVLVAKIDDDTKAILRYLSSHGNAITIVNEALVAEICPSALHASAAI